MDRPTRRQDAQAADREQLRHDVHAPLLRLDGDVHLKLNEWTVENPFAEEEDQEAAVLNPVGHGLHMSHGGLNDVFLDFKISAISASLNSRATPPPPPSSQV